jgi:hypothetical protein
MRRIVDLATRSSGSIEVVLLYDRLVGTLAVFVRDAVTDEEFFVPVTGEEAAEVYRHPYAYAHRATRASPSHKATRHSHEGT